MISVVFATPVKALKVEGTTSEVVEVTLSLPCAVVKLIYAPLDVVTSVPARKKGTE
jgi:hypothetical protein